MDIPNLSRLTEDERNKDSTRHMKALFRTFIEAIKDLLWITGLVSQ